MSTVSYWHEARRPLISLVFISPLLACYEAGMLALGTRGVRNGADIWLRSLLDGCGLGQYLLLPALTCGGLLAWHHLRRDRWHVSARVLAGMLLETCAWAALLFGLAQVLLPLLDAAAISDIGLLGRSKARLWGQLAGYCGAGIYEELLFRLLLLPVCVGLFGLLVQRPATRITLAVVVTSLVFAAAHYRFEVDLLVVTVANPYGESFAMQSFCFRAAAGMFFAMLFLTRGFGIAAAAHAVYDIAALWSSIGS